MKAYKPEIRLPKQGQKVNAFYNGDCIVVKRLKDKWYPLPAIEKHLYIKMMEFGGYTFCCPPDFWSEITFPKNLTGIFYVMIPDPKDNEKYLKLTMDRYEELFPEEYEKYCNDFYEGYIKNMIED